MAKHPKLDDVDLTASLSRATYDEEIERQQHRMMMLQQAYLSRRDRAAIVFEGWDAAGKGGTIRRLAWALDPRGFKVWPIAAPNEMERRLHYLQRFWTRLPAHGEIAVFDRSWYGRVLVERVEGFATKPEWKRAFGEINDFEEALVEDGMRIVKIFLHVSAETQRERFVQRISDPLKRWKLTYEDLRNWHKRDAYVDAIGDMLERTSTSHAPWHVIPANDKLFARVESLRVIADVLGRDIDVTPPMLDATLLAAAREHLGMTEEELSKLLPNGKGKNDH